MVRATTKIDDLPEDILLRVLSHLTTRETIRTWVLSQYWRDLWRSVPCIDVSILDFEGKSYNKDVHIEEFEDHREDDDDSMSMEEFEGDNDDDGMSVEEAESEDIGMSTEEEEEEEEEGMDDGYDECEVAFKRFVNRFLRRRNPAAPLDELRLIYSVSIDSLSNAYFRDANRWISYALRHKARVVQVVNRNYALQLDPAVFTSSFLNRLNIASAILPAGFFNQLQMDCPALEYMCLYDCTIGDLEVFSSTLKVLILCTEVYFSFEDGAQASISAPSLISLSITEDLSGARLPILDNMPSLQTASVSLSPGYIKTCDADGLRQFLGGLCDVTSLDFSYWDKNLTMERSYRWCPTFSKLVDLTLDCSFVNGDLYGLIVFLKNSPNLKRLTLYVGQSDTTIAGELEDRYFTCKQLEFVEIRCWGPSEMLDRVTQFWHSNGISPYINDRRKANMMTS